MNVYILGIDHEIQIIDGRRTPAEKNEFEKLLMALISEHQIEFIGDETYENKNAIAERVADFIGIRWEPIEMSKKARIELGIAEEQRNQRFEPVIGDDGLPTAMKQNRVLSDGIREEYMVWRSLTKAGEVKSILVLCGFLHADQLRQRFEKLGHHVIPRQPVQLWLLVFAPRVPKYRGNNV